MQVRSGSRSFQVTEFGKDEARISQGAIVDNKLLDGALHHIKEQQKVREAEKLQQLCTQREKQLLRKRARAVA